MSQWFLVRPNVKNKYKQKCKKRIDCIDTIDYLLFRNTIRTTIVCMSENLEF